MAMQNSLTGYSILHQKAITLTQNGGFYVVVDRGQHGHPARGPRPTAVWEGVHTATKL